LLAFYVGFGLNGLWFGLIVGLLFVCLAEFEYLRRRNWVEQAKRAVYNAAHDSPTEAILSDNLYTVVEDLSSFSLGDDEDNSIEYKGGRN
jgi:hypothetical protein